MPQNTAFLTHEEIQQEELNMLVAFDGFCKEKGLYYSLAGGTLLGAVRHQGFIPWDDDIDVCMPRDDYEQFLARFDEFEQRTGYVRIPYGRSEKHFPFVKVSNPRIAVQDQADSSRSRQFLWFDVFPVDGLPDDPRQIASIYRKAKCYRNLVWLPQTKWTFGDSFARKLVKCLLGPIVCGLKIDGLCAKKLNALARSYDVRSSDTVGDIVWGLYGVGEAVAARGFFEEAYLPFCGYSLAVMSCYDEYLSGLYGDYMQLPPEDKRSTHGLLAWRV